MKKTIFVLSGLLFSFISYAQSGNKIDSLRNLQIQGKTDSIKARASFLLSDEYSQEPEKGKAELDIGLKLSKDNKFLTGVYHFYYGQLLFYKEPENAINQYKKGITLLEEFKSTESLEFQARAWYNIGAQYDYLGDSEIFMAMLMEHCIPLAKKAKNDKFQARYNYTIGMLLMNLKDYPLAEAYYQKSIAYHQNLTNTDELDHLEALIGAATNFLHQEKTDATKYYLDQALPLANRHKNDPLYISLKETEVNYYNVIKNYVKAERFAKEVIRTVNSTGDASQDYRLRALYFQLFKALSEQGKYAEAKAILEALKPGLMVTPNNRRIYFSHMAELHERTKDFATAYDWLKKAYILRDSIYNDDFRKEINVIDKKLKLSEKENRITLLEVEKKETLLIRKNQTLLNWLLGIGAAVFLLAFILSVYIYRNRQQRTILKLKELEKQKELELTQAILEGEERERQRIARDLHDGLGGALSGIKIKLSGVQNPSDTPVIGETILQLEHSIGELRRIARNMMPETLIRSGLEVALYDLCVSLSSEKTVVECQPNGMQREIPLQSQVNIYRIIQELIANAIRHGKASKIIVQCIQSDNHFLLTVEDNGKGFDPKQKSLSNGIGLINIKNRVDLMKGKMQIDAAANEGTTVNIELYG
ncbi:sensor histidine kinase [Taibaiella sp. KBW10]|uniref:tetratricopeptide repeat-containing sensor histidine kinase n=1 Tax=Taibaiella sp. KBW10 TaxID=2153357 RepID=UPI0013156B15|nr:sensor histidine kinase [Taibaiella sp. KBW10]